ncbi:MAG: hypothetical protein H7Y14_01470 [Burkholderiales bacterium]|nr:hypothetical protein [Burkholderiales bacterium]
MLFIWGKKQVQRSLGYVADFCPVCRDLRVFQMKRLGLAGHFYYVSFGEGRLIAHVRTCTVCDIDLNGRPELYKAMNRNKLPATELAGLTRPDWQQAHASRLALERELTNAFGKVPADVRKALIREPFDLLAPKVEDRMATTQFDGWVAAAVGVLFILIVIAVKAAEQFPGAGDYIWGAAWGFGLAAIASQFLLVRRRFFRKHVFPPLTLALRPLKPTRAELESALAAKKAEGTAIVERLDLRAFMRELERTGGTARTALLDAGDMRASGGV